MTWVPTIAVSLAAALLFGLVARRIGLSPIVGYLVAGVAIGPHTPGFMGDMRLASQIADVGVILLMFGVGLGFSLRDLAAVRRIAIPGALIASGVSVSCGALLGVLAGLDPGDAVVFGMYLLHGAFDNHAADGAVRLSVDVRWQPAADARDPRYFGPRPAGTTGAGYGELNGAKPLTEDWHQR